MRLIDVDAFKAYYRMADECEDCQTPFRTCRHDRMYAKMDFCSWLDDAPTVTPERNRGKWIKKKSMIYCSQCACSFDSIFTNDFYYCPHCGADMRKEVTR